MNTTFAELGVPDALVQALRHAGIETPFEIQAATMPDTLAGRDLCGRAPTGSGKTVAFGVPLVARCRQAKPKRPSALVLAPTRELAEQITTVLRPLAHSVQKRVLAVYGGVGVRPQITQLARGIDILVACPGRLHDLIDQGAVQLDSVSIVVIDEADRMADMGFLPEVKRLLDLTAARRQTMLFSATLDGDVAVLTRDYQHNPVRKEIGPKSPDVTAMEHHFWAVDRNERSAIAAQLIKTVGKTIVFTRTRHGADRAAKQLLREGVEAVAIHGGRSQNQRDRALAAFTSGNALALVATDVAARGIHVDDVSCVLHFDPPEDEKAYLHRSGRTARAGARGRVVCFVEKAQRKAVKHIQRKLKIEQPVTEPELDSIPVTPPPTSSKRREVETVGTERPSERQHSKQGRPNKSRPNRNRPKNGARKGGPKRNDHQGSGQQRNGQGKGGQGKGGQGKTGQQNRSKQGRPHQKNSGKPGGSSKGSSGQRSGKGGGQRSGGGSPQGGRPGGRPGGSSNRGRPAKRR